MAPSFSNRHAHIHASGCLLIPSRWMTSGRRAGSRVRPAVRCDPQRFMEAVPWADARLRASRSAQSVTTEQTKRCACSERNARFLGPPWRRCCAWRQAVVATTGRRQRRPWAAPRRRCGPQRPRPRRAPLPALRRARSWSWLRQRRPARSRPWPQRSRLRSWHRVLAIWPHRSCAPAIQAGRPERRACPPPASRPWRHRPHRHHRPWPGS